ncbi:MAG: hypothetical protein HOI23_04630 [Deltaproteobacteria bacterium]|jgi:hypothetical protein|nr:hypothetical protein [Deltaproteobacteria bacterium]MBT6433700.1 hypothetical protein [Deltaproteobacteria bacterium]MBT6489752.1 hypothetical protein [Deltaproteobacteria bacterium]
MNVEEFEENIFAILKLHREHLPRNFASGALGRLWMGAQTRLSVFGYPLYCSDRTGRQVWKFIIYHGATSSDWDMKMMKMNVPLKVLSSLTELNPVKAAINRFKTVALFDRTFATRLGDKFSGYQMMMVIRGDHQPEQVYSAIKNSKRDHMSGLIVIYPTDPDPDRITEDGLVDLPDTFYYYSCYFSEFYHQDAAQRLEEARYLSNHELNWTKETQNGEGRLPSMMQECQFKLCRFEEDGRPTSDIRVMCIGKGSKIEGRKLMSQGDGLAANWGDI